MADNARNDTQRPVAVSLATGLLGIQLSSATLTLTGAMWTPELVSLSTPLGDVASGQQVLVILALALGLAAVVASRLWNGHGWAWSAALGISFTVLYARILLLGTGAVMAGQSIVIAGTIGDISLLVVLVLPSVRRWVGRSR